MKKGIILLLFVFLLIGIIIGSKNNIGSSNYFEEAKNEFEESIKDPDNEYQSKYTKVEGNILSNIAVKIDEKLSDLLTSVLEKIA